MGSRHPVVLFLLLWLCAAPTLRSDPKPVPLRFLPGAHVEIQDEFWTPILTRNGQVTIPYLFQKAEETGVIDNFSKAGGLMPGHFRGLPNSDEVLYESIEAASYLLARHPDPKLDAYLDGLIQKITAAQESDGYLLTHRTIAIERERNPAVPARWSNLGGDLELYMCGHLYEAAAAHFLATGKKSLLAVATKNADLLVRLFGADRRRDVCGHPNVEQALIRLYEVTGSEDYWRLARFFLDERGRAVARQPRGPLSQDHTPIIQQDQAVGLASRASYLYSAVADIARTSEDPLYTRPLDRLWANVTARKLYLTGGLGSRESNESLANDYELPNLTSFTETCAAVSFSMWNQRMFRLTGDGKYLDVLERTLYNNLLAGVSMTGDQFFYTCPTESDGKLKFNKGVVPKEFLQDKYADAAAARKPWFVRACCPPNLARYLEQVPSLIYAASRDDIFVNLFVGSQVAVDRGEGQKVTIRQRSRYPWEGKVQIAVQPDRAQRFRLRIRIPGWARNTPVPSDLYTFLELAEVPEVTVTLNGQAVPLELERGFLSLDREWSAAGDSVEVNFAMPVHRILCAPAVKENVDKVALQRGPIVYCAEAPDNRGEARNLVLQDDASLHARFRPDLLNGVMTVFGLGATQSTTSPDSANVRAPASRQTSRRTQLRPLLAIPYYAWANRGPGEMIVWLWREQ